MGILHVAPGDSAGGSLLQAVRASGRNEQVIRHLDDLSCGPIASDDPLMREAWWAQVLDEPIAGISLAAFRDRIADIDDHPVIWFGRHSAMELAFYLAWVDRLGDRPYDVVDVTGLELPFTLADGSGGMRPPAQAAWVVSSDGFESLLDHRRPITPAEREAAGRRWRELKQENAPFRIIAETGLVSAPIHYFDSLILEQAATKWHKVDYVIACTMGNNCEPYWQVGSHMLLTRVVALVSQGRLIADGDPWEMRSCRVRLPD